MRIFNRAKVESYCGPTTVYHILSEILPWIVFLGTVSALIAAWGSIPERIPMQMDYQGRVTDWGAKGNLIWLCAVYLVINLTLWIVGYFPQSWNNGMRVRAFGLGKQNNSVRDYRLTRDLLCDLRISMSVLFSGLLLWTAFGSAGRLGAAINIAVPLLIGIPLARYLVRKNLFR